MHRRKYHSEGAQRRCMKVQRCTAVRCAAIFQVALPNAPSVISHIPSITASTGYVERIFSRMASKCVTTGTGAEEQWSSWGVSSWSTLSLTAAFWKTNSYSELQGVIRSRRGKRSNSHSEEERGSCWLFNLGETDPHRKDRGMRNVLFHKLFSLMKLTSDFTLDASCKLISHDLGHWKSLT